MNTSTLANSHCVMHACIDQFAGRFKHLLSILFGQHHLEDIIGRIMLLTRGKRINFFHVEREIEKLSFFLKKNN